MTLRTCIAVLLGAAGLISVSGAPAMADRLSVVDGAGDVWRFEPTAYVPKDEPAGTQANVDVTRTTVDHLRRQVRVRVQYADLVPIDGAWQFDLRLRTDTGAQYEVVLTGTAADPAGSTALWKEGDPSAICSTVRHRFDYEMNVATLAVPRRCLGRPSSVRFIARAAASHWPSPGTEVDYNDDPTSDQARSAGVWSQAVPRGTGGTTA